MGRLSNLKKKFFDRIKNYQDGDLPTKKNFLRRILEGKPTAKEVNKKLLRKKNKQNPAVSGYLKNKKGVKSALDLAAETPEQEKIRKAKEEREKGEK